MSVAEVHHVANAEQPGVVTAALVDHLTKESHS